MNIFNVCVLELDPASSSRRYAGRPGATVTRGCRRIYRVVPSKAHSISLKPSSWRGRGLGLNMNEFLKDSDVREALSLAENANLAHPASALLSCFILDALNPQLAAKHVLEGCRRSQDLEAVLLSLVSDWSYIVESSMIETTPPV